MAASEAISSHTVLPGLKKPVLQLPDFGGCTSIPTFLIYTREYFRPVSSLPSLKSTFVVTHHQVHREKCLTEKMCQNLQQTKHIRLNWICAGVLLGTAVGSLAAQTTSAPPNNYLVHNLVSDLANTADHQDQNLVNPWGLGFGPTPFWVGNNGKGTATLYDGIGAVIPLVVAIPQAGDAGTAGPVTGV